MADLATFLRNCRELADGFIASSNDKRWRLGAVLFAEASQGIVIVRKASVTGSNYEFEGLWALPGGMARAGSTTSDAVKALEQSLQTRAEREAGLGREDLSGLATAQRVGPVVTSYTAKGVKRFTLIVAYVCQVAGSVRLESGDGSIDEACWMQGVPDWERFAPANRVLLAHLLWDRLDEDMRTLARAAIGESVAQCAAWASEVAIDPVPSPWGPSNELEAWRNNWPEA